MRTSCMWSLVALLAVAAPRGVSAAPNCDGEERPPICECRGRTGPARAKCLRCVANPEREECVEDPPVSGTISPRYLVLTVVYAPPGTAGTGARSSVEYASGSTTGVSTSIENAFKAETETTATASFLGLIEAGISGSFSTTSTRGQSIDIKKAQTEIIRAQGGNADGINHDADVIYLLLNPKVGVVARDNNAQWTLGLNGTAMHVQYVYVSWLKNPSTMPAGVQQRLTAAGITAADYPEIMARDPFASGSTTIDSNRFRQTNVIYPYEPPLDAGTPPPTWTTILRNQTITTTSRTTNDSYSVGFSLGTGPIADWFNAKLKTTLKFTWTNTSKWSTSDDSSQSATLTITSPSFGYTGSTAIAVYWDSVYGSFMFAPAPLPTPSARGTIVDAGGKPVTNKEVVLNVGRKQWRTFTNKKGEYKFFGTPKRGNALLDVGGHNKRMRVQLKPELGELRLAP